MSFRLVAAMIAVILATSPADAQEQGQSLGEVQTRLRRGDRIRVVDHNGAVIEGRFEGISGSSLRLVRKATALELPEAQINRNPESASRIGWHSDRPWHWCRRRPELRGAVLQRV